MRERPFAGGACAQGLRTVAPLQPTLRALAAANSELSTQAPALKVNGRTVLAATQKRHSGVSTKAAAASCLRYRTCSTRPTMTLQQPALQTELGLKTTDSTLVEPWAADWGLTRVEARLLHDICYRLRSCRRGSVHHVRCYQVGHGGRSQYLGRLPCAGE